MMRSLIFLLQVGLVVAFVTLLTVYPGHVVLNWQGYTIETSTTLLALMVLLVAGVIYLLISFIGSLKRLPLWFASLFRRRSPETLEAHFLEVIDTFKQGSSTKFAEALEALEEIVYNPVLKKYLKAKHKAVAESPQESAPFFQDLAAMKEGGFLGAYELALQALQDKNFPKALVHAHQAFKANKKAPQNLKLLFYLTLKQENLHEAQELLPHLVKEKVYEEDRLQRIQAGLWYLQSLHTPSEKEKESLLKKALDWDPGLVPAALDLAPIFIKKEKKAYLKSLVEECWALSPHPGLVPFYLQFHDAPMDRTSQMEKLVQVNPNHPLSHEELAKSYLEAELWGKARETLEKIPQEALTVSACLLWAQLERSEYGNEVKAEEWNQATIQARPSAFWICNHCHKISPTWVIQCEDFCPPCSVVYVGS